MTQLLLLLQLLLGPVDGRPSYCDQLPPGDAAAAWDCMELEAWLAAAGVPRELWGEFLAVAACESGLDPDPPPGDGGQALGILQIHWWLWSGWARDQGHDYQPEDWRSPILSMELALLIQDYSLARGRGRWDQWSVDPSWPICRYRLEEELAN